MNATLTETVNAVIDRRTAENKIEPAKDNKFVVTCEITVEGVQNKRQAEMAVHDLWDEENHETHVTNITVSSTRQILPKLRMEMSPQEELECNGGSRIFHSSTAQLPSNSRKHSWTYKRMSVMQWKQMHDMFCTTPKGAEMLRQCVVEVWSINNTLNCWVKMYKSTR